MLEAELDESTEEAKSNYRNGYTSKTLKSSVGAENCNVCATDLKYLPRW